MSELRRFDLRDWLVGGLVPGMWTFASVYLWQHPTDINFATWATASATMIGAYHYLNIKDTA